MCMSWYNVATEYIWIASVTTTFTATQEYIIQHKTLAFVNMTRYATLSFRVMPRELIYDKLLDQRAFHTVEPVPSDLTPI